MWPQKCDRKANFTLKLWRFGRFPVFWQVSKAVEEQTSYKGWEFLKWTVVTWYLWESCFVHLRQVGTLSRRRDDEQIICRIAEESKCKAPPLPNVMCEPWVLRRHFYFPKIMSFSKRQEILNGTSSTFMLLGDFSHGPKGYLLIRSRPSWPKLKEKKHVETEKLIGNVFSCTVEYYKDAVETFMNITTKKKFSPSHNWPGMFPKTLAQNPGQEQKGTCGKTNALSKNQQKTYANQIS